MTLPEFITQYDKADNIVLLEGKRTVHENDKAKLIALGKFLASNTQHMIFRSGNAEGADQYFSEGLAAIDNTRLQVIIPYAGHRKKTNLAYETIELDTIQLAAEPEVIYYSKGNKKTENLIDQYVAGKKDRYSIKAAYIIRDTIKAIGTRDIRPATFGIFYDDLSDPRSGGTGHTMKVCEEHGIPVIDQSVWFDWVNN